jgi:hypothetical protein
MVVGMGAGFGRKFGVRFFQDADIGGLFSVASSGLFLSFKDSGRQMLG